MATATIDRPWTTGDICRMTGAPGWTVRGLLDSGRVATAQRAGLYRLVTAEQLPAVLEELSRRGYPARREQSNERAVNGATNTATAL